MELSRRPMYFEPFAGGAALLFKLYDAAPFLRWVGGKRQLLPELHARLPLRSEPFLTMLGSTEPVACIGDINWRLMATYFAVAAHVEDVITILASPTQRSGKGPLEDTQDCYYYVRDTLNAIKRSQVISDASLPMWRIGQPPARQYHNFLGSRVAAAMVYLNRTGFNGLYRENANGHMNTPYGHNVKHGIVKEICDGPALRRSSVALQHVELRCEDFRKATEDGIAGDFFYFDPPYYPVKPTTFRGYSFGGGDVYSINKDLADECRRLDRLGARFLVSNADAPEIHTFYQGFTVERITARRNVNSDPRGRGPVGELLIRNY